MNYPQQMYMQGRPTYMDTLQQQMQYYQIKGRPVASFEEAKVSMIDFDGSVFYFPDTANHRIYTKQINLDGTSSLKTYALVENPIPQQTQQTTSQPLPNTNDLVHKEEFENAIKQLSSEIQTLKGAQNNNDESSTTTTTTIPTTTNDATTFNFK